MNTPSFLGSTFWSSQGQASLFPFGIRQCTEERTGVSGHRELNGRFPRSFAFVGELP